MSKKIRTSLRIWAGGFIHSNNLPNQYRTYLSGGVDPDFRSSSIFNRTGQANDISIGSRQFILDGPSLHGLVLNDNGKMKTGDDWLISINSEISLPKIPGKLFADAAFIYNKDVYFDLGWKTSLGFVSLIIPIYQSWDEQSYPENKHWLLDRMRFSINLPNFNIRGLF